MVIAAKEIMRQQDIIKEIFVNRTGQSLEKITHDMDRDFYLDPNQAVEYGLIDEVLTKAPDTKEEKAKKEKK
jgi:ATP-dependent Clp protease protease subunit